MMKRSIVTTDVEVCWTTVYLYTLGGPSAARLAANWQASVSYGLRE
jgi:hypothetical protein